MKVKIVTDSSADIPEDVVRELDITVVPLYILFGNQTYHDGIDISREEFYDRLLNGPVHPTTSQPTPQDFIKIYESFGPQSSGILSIHLSTKLSGTYNSAIQAADKKKYGCPIEVIDSRQVSIALGIIVIQAARMAAQGQTLAQIKKAVDGMLERVHILVLFDTLKYLAKGGRIGKAKSLLGAVLNVKPILALKEGEFEPSGQVRNRNKGIEKLVQYATSQGELEELCVVHSTTPEEAEALADRLGEFFPRQKILIAYLGVALATHGGPGILGTVIMTKN